MANLARVRVQWGGLGVVGPGLSTHYFDEAGNGWSSDLNVFYDAVKGLFPAGLTWTIPNSGDLIDVATGGISGAWTDAGGGTVTAATAGGFAVGVGGRIEWHTSGIRNGRRVTGSTFMVPLLASSFSSSGFLQSAPVSTLNAAAVALLSQIDNVMHIYSKPTAASPVGASHEVTSQEVTTQVSTLRSRRT